MENAVQRDGSRWLGSVYEVVVVVGWCLQQRKVAGSGWGQNKKPSYNSPGWPVWGRVRDMSGYAGFYGLTVPLRQWKPNEWGAVSK
jgi:hypothetical protein